LPFHAPLFCSAVKGKAEVLLKNADTAMYHAKQVKSMYCLYDDSM